MIGAMWQQTTWTDAVVNRLNKRKRVSRWYMRCANKEPQMQYYIRVLHLRILTEMLRRINPREAKQWETRIQPNLSRIKSAENTRKASASGNVRQKKKVESTAQRP